MFGVPMPTPVASDGERNPSPMTTIAQLLDRRSDQIGDYWITQLERRTQARGSTREQMLGSLLAHLKELTAALRKPLYEALASGIVEAPLSLRLRQGFNLDEVVREYVLLGECISQMLATLAPPDVPRVEDVAAVRHALDAAITTAVETFGRHLAEDERNEKRYLGMLDELATGAFGLGAARFQERTKSVVELVREAVGADMCALLLHDGATPVLSIMAVTGLPADATEWVNELQLDVSGVTSEEPLPIEREITEEGSEALRRTGMRVVRAHPLWFRDRLFGRLCVGCAQRTEFLPREHRRLGAMSTRLAVLMDNAELLEQVGRTSERIEAERLLLRVSEAKFAGIVSLAADAIISIDDTERITLFNDGAQQIFGYSPQEALGAPLEMLIPERFRAIHREHVRNFATNPVTARRMAERHRGIFGRRKNGEEFPAEAAISQLEVAGSKVLTVVLRDITDHAHAEEEHRFLTEAGAILSSSLDYEHTLSSVAKLAVESLADCCVIEIVQADGSIQRRKVSAANPKKPELAEWLGHSPSDPLSGVGFSKVLTTRRPELIAELPPGFLEFVTDGDEPLRRTLEEQNPRSLMAVPLIARDALLGVLFFLSSKPGRRYGQEDLRLADELGHRAAIAVDNARLYRAAQRAVGARDEVLAIVAHDLRSPLSTILVGANALLRRSPEDPSTGMQDALHAIVRSAERMNRLISDLLDIARIEAGRLSLERVRQSAGALVLEAAEMLRPVATSPELRAEIPNDLPAVFADRERILQVLSNLVANAMKFAGDGGRITIGASALESEVRFSVADTGKGIPADQVERVFDRFWQKEKGDRRGAGLGLSICRGIVEAHGGKIWAESTPGRGSTFFFTLPLASVATDRLAEGSARS